MFFLQTPQCAQGGEIVPLQIIAPVHLLMLETDAKYHTALEFWKTTQMYAQGTEAVLTLTNASARMDTMELSAIKLFALVWILMIQWRVALTEHAKAQMIVLANLNTLAICATFSTVLEY